ncbi:MAG TPA: hypothetical protein DDZ51_08210 [Planctomycetaceae bacterium]|nr:hypothetical protein [Planctomycetaceae bacterium]
MKTQREQLIGALASTAAKAVTGMVASTGTKTLMRTSSPGLLVGDAFELGSRVICEHCGMEDRTAETVSTLAGAGATVVAGATLGAFGGPIGAIIGAGTGFGFWCVGKVTSEVVGHVIHQAIKQR